MVGVVQLPCINTPEDNVDVDIIMLVVAGYVDVGVNSGTGVEVGAEVGAGVGEGSLMYQKSEYVFTNVALKEHISSVIISHNHNNIICLSVHCIIFMIK